MGNNESKYSVKDVLNRILTTDETAIKTNATVSVDNMEITAELSQATGHDYYVTTTNVGDGVDTISFDTVTGLVLGDIIRVENKTQGAVYVTAGATVTTTSIQLDLTKQESGYPVPGATDEFEIVYRGTSRFDAITTSLGSLDNAVATDDSAQSATPAMLNIGGEYRASATTYTDGDAAIAQMDINGHLKVAGYDSSTESIKVTETNPLSEQYTTYVDLLGGTPYELTSTFGDCGTETACAGYKTCTFWANVDINSSENPRFKIMAKPIYGGAVEVPLSSASVTIHTDNTYTAASASRYFELNDDADQWVQIDVELNNTIAGIQIMASDSNDSDGQIDNLYVVLGY